MKDFIVSMAAGLGILLSAETLVLLGNGMGKGGAWFAVFVLAGAGVHLLGAFTLFKNLSGPGAEIHLLQKGMGSTAALVFPFAARVAVALVAATGLLATAGFVFNEVFLYWFPNFLFAFLLLGLIVVVNLAGRRVWGGFQTFAMVTVLAWLVVLIIAGILSHPDPTTASPQVPSAESWLRLALIAVLIPVGYDLAFLADEKTAEKCGKSSATAILLGSIVLMLWGFVSLRWVDPGSLARSTIPYTVAARTILGQEGRIIMGVVILAGVAGAINSLFGGISRMMGAMSDAELLPASLGAHRLKGWGPVLFLGAATATMLLTGMAGSSSLDAYLRGGLILWLIHYAALHLAAALAGRQEGSRPAGRTAHILGGTILGLAALGLLVFGEETKTTVIFMFIVAGSVLILGVLWNGLSRRRDRGR